MVNRKTLTRQTKQARGIAEAKPKTCAKIPRGSLSQEQFCLFDHRAAAILAQTPEATTARHQEREHRATEVTYYNCVGPYRERTCVCMFVSVFASSELRMLTAACDRAQRTKELDQLKSLFSFFLQQGLHASLNLVSYFSLRALLPRPNGISLLWHIFCNRICEKFRSLGRQRNVGWPTDVLRCHA